MRWPKRKLPKVGVIAGLSVLAFSLAIFLRTNRAIPVQVPDGPITAVEFDSANSELKLSYPSNQLVTIGIERADKDAEIFLLQPRSSPPDTLRFLSKKYYASLGQENEGLFVLSHKIRPDEIRADAYNSFAEGLPSAQALTIVDTSLIAIKALTDRYNIFKHRYNIWTHRVLCTSDDAKILVQKLRADVCYVACSGLSIIASQMLPAPSRIVLLYGRTDKLDGDLSFLWSEWHTTVEVFGDGKWYVADPTFGFAYVKDGQGKRLDTAELIKEIYDGRSANLIFGVLSGDQIHDLTGDRMLQEQPTLAALYYTSDKQPTYLSVTQPTTIKLGDKATSVSTPSQ